MTFNLGIMSVGFEMDLSGLTSGATKAESIIEGLSRIGEEAGAMLTESFSMPDESISLLVEELSGLRRNLGLLSISVEELTSSVDAGFAQMAEETSIAAENMDSSLMSIQEHAMSAGNAVREVGSTSHKAGGGFLSLAGNIGMAAMGFQMVGQIAMQAGQALLMPAANLEQIEGSLEIFTGSAASAKKELQELSDFASHTPFETGTIDQAALKLQSVGISSKEVIPDLLSLGDSLDAVGRTSAADLGQLTDAFVKIQTQGHLTTETMDSFASMGVDAWSVLEKQTGKTHAQLQKLISAGLYPAKDAMHDLTVGIEANPLYKGQMANDANVFNGSLSTLKSNFEQIIAAFGSPVIKALEPLMANLAKSLSSPAFKEFATKFGTQITQIAGNLGKFFSNPAFAQFAQQFGGLIGGTIQKVLTYLSSPEFGKFTKWLGDGLVGAAKLVAPFIQSIVHDFQEFGKQIGPVLTPLLQGFIKFLGSPEFQGFVKMIGEGIAGAIHIALPLIGEIIKNVVKFAQEIAVRVQPFVEKFLAWWNLAWPGIAMTFKGVWDMISGIVKVAWSLISGIIKIGLDLLSGNWKQAWTDLKDMLSGVWDGILTFLGGVGETIVGILFTAGSAIYDALKKPFSDAWDFISNFFGNVGQLFNDLVSLNFGAIPDDMSKLMGGPSEHLQQAPASGGGHKSFASGVVNFEGGLAKVHKDELIYLPQGSNVYTAAQSASMMAGSGGGEIHLHNHIYLDGQQMAMSMMPHVNQMALEKHGARARVA